MALESLKSSIKAKQADSGKHSLNTEYAMPIEAALDLDAEPLPRMHTSYDLQMAKKDNGFMEKLNKV